MAPGDQVAVTRPPLGEGATRAALDQLPDNELLALCRGSARQTAAGTAACDVLVRRYASLVRACARPYLDGPETAEDLMQVGFVGLLKAVNNYDPAFGNGLQAYAMPCITGELKKHFRDKRWQVRVARPLQELVLAMRAATQELTHELGCPPLDSELASRVGVTADELRQASQAAEGLSALSLDVPAGDGEDSAELHELLGGTDAGFEQVLGMEAVGQHWDELARPEQQVLLLRFYGNLTQQEVAARLGTTQMQVSRLQARALARLRGLILDTADA